MGKYRYRYRNCKKDWRGEELMQLHHLLKKVDGGKFGKTENGNIWAR